VPTSRRRSILRIPKLAGQYPDYLYAALRAYQVDHNAVLGRSNAIMMGMARPFKHAEIKALAQYISTLARRPQDGRAVALPLSAAIAFA
jgi:cytochrome c553